MARAKAEAQHDQRTREGHGRDPVRQTTERFAEVEHEGIQRTVTASQTAATGALRTGDALAKGAQEVTAACARYTDEVMRYTSEASQALIRARTFTEILEVQGNLLRSNLEAFFALSTRIAEATSRMATRPIEALRQTSAEQRRG
jgi:hypothetical protein